MFSERIMRAARVSQSGLKQAALCHRQILEDCLLAEGRRHVTIEGIAGQFEWLKFPVRDEPAEDTDGHDVCEFEQMIVTNGWHNILLTTRCGTFFWRAHSS
jgi:hypothetical protein